MEVVTKDVIEVTMDREEAGVVAEGMLMYLAFLASLPHDTSDDQAALKSFAAKMERAIKQSGFLEEEENEAGA